MSLATCCSLHTLYLSTALDSSLTGCQGPLMLVDACVARPLIFSEHSNREQSLAMKLANSTTRPVRVLVDVLLGYILASSREGRGLNNISWVDIGLGCGFHEMRPHTNVSLLALSPCFRALHFGRATLRTVQGGYRERVAEWTESIGRMHAERRSSLKRSRRPLIACNRSQPGWWRRSNYVVATGSDWWSCYVR